MLKGFLFFPSPFVLRRQRQRSKLVSSRFVMAALGGRVCRGQRLHRAARDVPVPIHRRERAAGPGLTSFLCPHRSGSQEPCAGTAGTRCPGEPTVGGTEPGQRRRDDGLLAPAGRRGGGQGCQGVRMPRAVGAVRRAQQPLARLPQGIPSPRQHGMRPPSAPDSSGDGRSAGLRTPELGPAAAPRHRASAPGP